MSPRCEFTSAIGPILARFVGYKRTMGLRYDPQCRLLELLDRFLAQAHAPDLTRETFAAWRSSNGHLTANGQRLRLQLVRRFCLYRRRTDPDCFVPDSRLFPRPQEPPRPHIFSEDDISRLLLVADALPAGGVSPLYPQGARLAVALFYTTGLRRSELVRLRLGDYDPVDRVLLIRDSKFHKSRMIPLSPDAAGEMERYLVARRRPGLPGGADEPLLLHQQRGFRGYSGDGLRVLMRRLYRGAGIRTAAGRLPRTHDLRFTFAVHALSRWYRAGADVQSRLPALAIYMGHVSVASTQYYLRLLDDVARSASERFDRHCRGFLPTPNDGGGQ